MSDLLVIGAGALGMLVARRWKTLHSSANVTLKFRSDNKARNAELEKEGFKIITKERGEKLVNPLVVFCAPPTGNDDYAEDIRASVSDHWEKSGLFVFTSSGSVYTENEGGEVDESSEVAWGERSGKLLDGEETVFDAGGSVLRLGGLYTETSGAHNYWCGGGAKEFPSKPGGLINLIHYEDAAEAVIACLEAPEVARGQVFLVADGVPMSRQDIAAAAAFHPKYRDSSEGVRFTGGPGTDGKKYNCQKIRSMLGWKPKHESYAGFMKERAEQV